MLLHAPADVGERTVGEVEILHVELRVDGEGEPGGEL